MLSGQSTCYLLKAYAWPADFLSKHGVSTEVIEVAKREKLTKRVMQYMTESDLEKVYPAVGDQLQFRPVMVKLKVSNY